MDKKFSRIQLVSVLILFALCLFSILNIASTAMEIQIKGLRLDNKHGFNIFYNVETLVSLIFAVIGTIMSLVFVFLISKDKVNAPRMVLINVIYLCAQLAIHYGLILGTYLYGMKDVPHNTTEHLDYQTRIYLKNYEPYIIIFGLLFIIGLIFLVCKKVHESKIILATIIISSIAMATLAVSMIGYAAYTVIDKLSEHTRVYSTIEIAAGFELIIAYLGSVVGNFIAIETK